jgi:hypothetical protein
VYDKIIKLENSRPNVTDEERPGRLSTSTTEENITGVRAMILVTIAEVAHCLSIGHDSAHGIPQD